MSGLRRTSRSWRKPSSSGLRRRACRSKTACTAGGAASGIPVNTSARPCTGDMSAHHHHGHLRVAVDDGIVDPAMLDRAALPQRRIVVAAAVKPQQRVAAGVSDAEMDIAIRRSQRCRLIGYHTARPFCLVQDIVCREQLVLVIGGSAGSVVEVAKLHLDGHPGG